MCNTDEVMQRALLYFLHSFSQEMRFETSRHDKKSLQYLDTTRQMRVPSDEQTFFVFSFCPVQRRFVRNFILNNFKMCGVSSMQMYYLTWKRWWFCTRSYFNSFREWERHSTTRQRTIWSRKVFDLLSRVLFLCRHVLSSCFIHRDSIPARHRRHQFFHLLSFLIRLIPVHAYNHLYILHSI